MMMLMMGFLVWMFNWSSFWLFFQGAGAMGGYLDHGLAAHGATGAAGMAFKMLDRMGTGLADWHDGGLSFFERIPFLVHSGTDRSCLSLSNPCLVHVQPMLCRPAS